MLFLFSITWGSVSGWWVPGCLVLGGLYAWLLYRQPTSLTKNWRYILGAIRTVVVALIAFLLLSPLIKSVTTHPQKPLILVTQDNSASIRLFKPAGFEPGQFVDQLGNLKKVLGDGYDVREFNFSDRLRDSLSTKFDGKQTDISGVFKSLNDRFSNQNIGAVVLATDGLYNKGSSPQYNAGNLKASVYTIALGDTVPKRDLLIANVNYNKTAFLGNDFEVEILTEAYQSKGENMRLSIAEDGGPVFSQNVQVTDNAFRKTITAKLHADKKGIHKFTFSIQPVANEISTANNTETIYIEVLDAKQKILLVYNGPHPDVTAIKQSLEDNRNYEVRTTLLSKLNEAELGTYSVAILYQLPTNSTSVIPSTLLSKLKQQKIPVWYMVGAQSDIFQVNAAQKIVRINAGRQDVQETFAMPDANFSLFTLTDSTRRELASLPPLSAPFGNYSVASAQSVLLKQKIGTIETSYPLLAFGEEDGRREAVLTGEGLWKWRLAEFQSQGNYRAFDELLGQSVQYLTAKNNKTRFRVYPAKNVFDDGEDVLFNAELYNDALELVNTPDVNIELKSKTGKTYNFVFTRNGQSYTLNAHALPTDEYTYSAKARLGDKTLTATGQFIIKPLNAETRQSAADHHLLYTLAHQNGGVMLRPNQIDKLAELIRKNENIKTLVYDDKTYKDLIDEKWLFVVILALLSAEWFLRKREGEA
ncbi:hypothetical protein BEL04_13275 [Mucilaginibacter sp. PPCGB 2223]|uniref:hypothetical protein n=1 Tax=Mucilaginibacter sp. PPCGB 2223 TaxID=1886027 RepID=UPI000826D234|nr:hypothetical protein [Mucilaginibacter sp. PPCGB 2223]OCX52430.1 hypothetical protein BEL04_13275 [Mucilaginibacter sp. PPCGB 2223]